MASGESYVAGGTALNEALASSRISRDIDLFHDTEAALDASWTKDRALLAERGCTVKVIRDRPGLVEAEVAQGADAVVVEWTRDSAFRFFPLVEHEDFGLVLHPFDLATNEVLALAGRLEPRDWVDAILSSERLQPLGYLAWAACGKDPGFSPVAIIEQAARANRYSADELQGLAFDGVPPDSADLSRRWHQALDAARLTIRALPATEVGTCVTDVGGHLFRGSVEEFHDALASGRIVFHRGTIRGAHPRVIAP